MDKRIGAQLFTLRNMCESAEAFKSTIKSIARVGFKTVHFSGILKSAGEPHELKSVFDKNGIEVIATHRPVDCFLRDIDSEINFHKTLGCKIAGISSLPIDMRRDLSAFRESVKRLNEVHRRLKDEGMAFAYHNYGYDFARIDGKTTFMDVVLEEGEFDLILDTYWIASVGIDPARYIKKVGDRCAVIHFKDLRVLPDKKVEYCEVGEGNLLWDEIIAASEKARYAVVEQDFCRDNPINCLKRSYDFLKSNFDLI